MVRYLEHSQKLIEMLGEDQAEKRELATAYFNNDLVALEQLRIKLKQATRQRTKRTLQILSEIGEPSITNIGLEGARAMSVLAVHDEVDNMKLVLAAFMDLYERNKEECHYQAIPSLTDQVLILEHQPQRFGTQWLFDEDKQPFLYPVEDFENVNKRRAEFGIEPLRWPKSMAIPESQQPWLMKPLSELIMREPTDEEYRINLL